MLKLSNLARGERHLAELRKLYDIAENHIPLIAGLGLIAWGRPLSEIDVYAPMILAEHLGARLNAEEV